MLVDVPSLCMTLSATPFTFTIFSVHSQQAHNVETTLNQPCIDAVLKGVPAGLNVLADCSFIEHFDKS